MKENMRSFLSYGSLGIELGLSVAIGIAIGFFLDRVFKTYPYLTIIFMLFGIISGFRTVYRILKKIERENQQNERGNN
ncbi:MAG: AtpZ/AtpI family protein [Deltaproteobacteria bacterium]|nr:AtpZ/AtpI family protein [Deltaproteobacteria bacterium]